MSVPTSFPQQLGAAQGINDLYPADSILEQIVELARRNTDLPPSAVLSAAYSHLSAAFVRAGFTLSHGSTRSISPNLYILGVGQSGFDFESALQDVVQVILASSKVHSSPAALTSGALFAICDHGKFLTGADSGAASPSELQARCTAYLIAMNSGEWLRHLHSTTGSETLRDYLIRGYGGGIFIQVKGTKLKETAPVHLVVFTSSQQTQFFTALGDHFYTSSLLRKFALVIADDKPIRSQAFPSSDGFKDAARRWASDWQEILAGPQSYRFAPEAVDMLERWWAKRIGQAGPADGSLRHYAELVQKYGLILQALIEPTGTVGPEAVTIAISVAERHLHDLHVAQTELANECEEQRLMRKVEEHMKKHLHATRGDIMRQLRGVKTAVKMNAALEAIMEMSTNDELRDRARELRAAAR